MSTRGSGDMAALVLEGEALVQDAEAVATEFAAVLDRKPAIVTMDLSGLTKVDVTFFQLLIACNNSITKRGGHLIVAGLPPAHPVMTTGELLGIKLEHHFPIAEAGS